MLFRDNKCNGWPKESAIISSQSSRGKVSASPKIILSVSFVSLSFHAVEFPCGRQQNEAFYHLRSLWSDSPPDNTTTASNATSWAGNSTDGWTNTTDEEQLALNVTFVQTGGNRTEQWEKDEEGDNARIVGGLLEKRGGSPWQVWRTFSVDFKRSIQSVLFAIFWQV